MQDGISSIPVRFYRRYRVGSGALFRIAGVKVSLLRVPQSSQTLGRVRIGTSDRRFVIPEIHLGSGFVAQDCVYF